MAEKRYFKLFATRHFPKDNTYHRLYEAIDAQEKYHEQTLTKQFAGGKSASYFPVLKKQLYDALLEALHRFEAYDDEVHKLTLGVHYCSLLLNRGLYAACAKQIKKYKAKGYAFEKFEEVIALIAIEKRLAARTQYIDYNHNGLAALHREELHCLEQIKITSEYWINSAAIYKMHIEKKLGPGRDNHALKSLAASPLFADASSATTFRARLDRMQVLALYAFAEQQTETAFDYNSAFLQLMDDQPYLRQQYADRYFATLNNYLIDCLILQKHEALIAGIQTLRKLPEEDAFRHMQHLDAQVFRMSYLLELNYYVGQEDFVHALSVATAVLAQITNVVPFIARPNLITLYYLCAYVLFCNKQFNKCLDALQTLMDMKDAETVIDLFTDSRMMQILCHFELGNILLIDSLIVSFNRHLESRKLKASTYATVLRTLKQHMRSPQKPLKQKLHQQLQTLSQQPEEKRLYNNFNYFWWLERVSSLQ